MLTKRLSIILAIILLSLTLGACQLMPTPAAAQGTPTEQNPPIGQQAQPGGAHQPPDLTVAAEILGITEQELMEALGPPPPDLAAAAQTLGVTEQELKNALFPDGAPISEPPAGSQPETTAAPAVYESADS